MRMLAGKPVGALLAVVVASVALVSATPVAAEDTPTPEPTAQPALSVELACTPDTFRPDEWVAVECVLSYTNEGEEPLPAGRAQIIGATTGPIVSYFFMSRETDGELVPVGATALSFEGRELEPGQTLVSRILVLMRLAAPGTSESELEVSVEGQPVQRNPIRFTATAGAAEPPTDILVTKELVSEPAGDRPPPTATFETTVTNEGYSEVTEVTLTDRYSDEAITLVSAEPAPAGQNPDVQLATWDLASFGKDSLAAGESLVLRTTYGPGRDPDCGYVTSGVVVEATVDGQEQRYGAWAPGMGIVGECQPPPRPEDGRGGPVGDGPGGGEITPPDEEMPVGVPATGLGGVAGDGHGWAVALAAGGMVLIGTALALRRRAAGR